MGNRYNLLETIGDTGGFGEVYSAQRQIDEIVTDEIYAVKILKNMDGDSIERFKKEVRLLSKLNHPRIIKVIDQNLETSEPFYVMPLYERSLKAELPSLVGNYKRLKNILNAILDGIEYLHTQGVVHRDLKPENILMNSDSDIVISDFGLGMQIDSETTRLTKTGTIMGTYFYASPEQMRDAKHISVQSDIYSFGKIMYECFTGDIGISVDKEALPKGVKFLVCKCLEVNPKLRYINMGEVRSTLNATLDMIIGGINTGEIKDLVIQLRNTDNYSEIIEKLVTSLKVAKLEEQQDTIHEMIIESPIEAVEEFIKEDKEVVASVIDTFIANITGQYWGYNYTDTIGWRCKQLFNICSDYEMKAKLLFCICEVGVSHNRYYVMDTFEELMYSIDDADLALAVVAIFEKKGYVQRVKDKFNLNADLLNPILRMTFQNNEAM